MPGHHLLPLEIKTVHLAGSADRVIKTITVDRAEPFTVLRKMR
jgi:hypothetical protein